MSISKFFDSLLDYKENDSPYGDYDNYWITGKYWEAQDVEEYRDWGIGIVKWVSPLECNNQPIIGTTGEILYTYTLVDLSNFEDITSEYPCKTKQQAIKNAKRAIRRRNKCT